MPTNQPDRIDRIEAAIERLEQTVENNTIDIQSLASAAQSQYQGLRVLANAAQIQYQGLQVLANTAQIQRESVAGLLQSIDILAQENRTARAEFQAEVLRIWEYLMDRRSGNGDQGA